MVETWTGKHDLKNKEGWKVFPTQFYKVSITWRLKPVKEINLKNDKTIWQRSTGRLLATHQCDERGKPNNVVNHMVCHTSQLLWYCQIVLTLKINQYNLQKKRMKRGNDHTSRSRQSVGSKRKALNKSPEINNGKEVPQFNSKHL